MKKQIFYAVLLFTIVLYQNILNSQINQQWKWIHPMPQGNTLNWVKAFSPADWMAIGNNGTFIKTSNAGISWDVYTNAGGSIQSERQGKSLRSAWFFNSLTGFVCGNYAWLAKTTNGGINWDSIGTTADAYTTLEDIQFINNSTGFISSGAVLLKTTNAGLNWISLQSVYTTIRGFCVIDENTIYCVGPGHFLKSTNGGNNWTTYNMSLNSPNSILFINANTGLLCGETGIVIVTTNGGDNWNSKPTTSFQALFDLIYINLPYGNTLYENFDGTSFPPSGWKAVNVLGNTIVWVRSTTGPHSPQASALILNDCNFSTGGGLDWLISPQIHVNSNDTLSFWIKPVLLGSTDSLCVRVSTTDTALSSFTTRVLYIADGAGYPTTSVWTNYKVSLNALTGQNIYIGFKHQDLCGDGLFLDDISVVSNSIQTHEIYAVGNNSYINKTTNMGDNWTNISVVDSTHKWTNLWYSMDVTGSTMVIAGGDGGINYSTNNGDNWTGAIKKTAGGNLKDIWCENSTGKVWAVGTGSSYGSFDQILYSSNGGNSFQVQTIPNSLTYYESISMIDVNTGYICGNYNSIRKTTNGGITWDSLALPVASYINLSTVDFVNANTGWVFSGTECPGGTIWRTTNGGLIWVQQALNDPIPGNNAIFEACIVNENTGYVLNAGCKIYVTTNSGNNWIARTQQIEMSGLNNDELYMLNANTGFYGGRGRIFRTINQWINYDTIITPGQTDIVSNKWFDMNTGFAGTSSGLFIRTTNGGNVWELMQTSASSLNRIYVKAYDTAYAVTTGGGILKLGMGFVGNISWKNTIPSQYFLGQNYPNPFNPVTEFKFGIATRAKINLKVYDITGRLVQTYFDNMELNAGTITVKFNGSNLASGVYFYTLFADDKRIDTKKMVLIK